MSLVPYFVGVHRILFSSCVICFFKEVIGVGWVDVRGIHFLKSMIMMMLKNGNMDMHLPVKILL